MNSLRLLLLLFFGVFTVIMLVSCQSSTVPDERSWKTVEHELYGFAMDYPPGWNAYTYGDWGYKCFAVCSLS